MPPSTWKDRFDLAYNAVHALALAALRHCGYRSESRYLVFQCLQHTLGLSPEQWRVLDQAHRKRNLAEYEGELDIGVPLVEAIIRIGREVERRLLELGKPPAYARVTTRTPPPLYCPIRARFEPRHCH